MRQQPGLTRDIAAEPHSDTTQHLPGTSLAIILLKTYSKQRDFCPILRNHKLSFREGQISSDPAVYKPVPRHSITEPGLAPRDKWKGPEAGQPSQEWVWAEPDSFTYSHTQHLRGAAQMPKGWSPKCGYPCYKWRN